MEDSEEDEKMAETFDKLLEKLKKAGFQIANEENEDEKELRKFTDQAAVKLHKRMLEEEEEVNKLYKVELFIWDYGGDIEDDEKENGLDSVMIHIDQQLSKYFNASPQLYSYEYKDVKNKIINKRDIDYKEVWEMMEDE